MVNDKYNKILFNLRRLNGIYENRIAAASIENWTQKLYQEAAFYYIEAAIDVALESATNRFEPPDLAKIRDFIAIARSRIAKKQQEQHRKDNMAAAEIIHGSKAKDQDFMRLIHEGFMASKNFKEMDKQRNPKKYEKKTTIPENWKPDYLKHDKDSRKPDFMKKGFFKANNRAIYSENYLEGVINENNTVKEEMQQVQ